MPSDSTLKGLLANKFTTVEGTTDQKRAAFITACDARNPLGQLATTNQDCGKLLASMQRDAVAINNKLPLTTGFGNKQKTTSKSQEPAKTETATAHQTPSSKQPIPKKK